MSEAVAESTSVNSSGEHLLTLRICWRNLWRNRRRTWLTAGGIAFSVFLVASIMAMQVGIYGTMIENATSLMSGHIQVQTAEFVGDSRFEDTIDDIGDVLGIIRSTPGVMSATARVEAFALLSVGERSFGAQVLGLDIDAEAETVRLVKMIASGRNIIDPDDAVLGTALARNLGVGIGDEVVVLGSGKEGGIAAMVVNVVGLLETGISDLDRVLIFASISSVQEAFGLSDEAHTIAVRTSDLERSAEIAVRLGERLPKHLLVRNWELVMAEVAQSIELDRVGGRFMYGLIMMLVVFSVVNSFIMTVFERTREFGMLRAIGMRPIKIIVMVQWEALFVCLVGIAVGLGLAVVLIVVLMDAGIYLGEQAQEYGAQFYLPERLYPGISTEVLLTGPIVLLIGTQIAAFLPALRIRRLQPVEALREA